MKKTIIAAMVLCSSAFTCFAQSEKTTSNNENALTIENTVTGERLIVINDNNLVEGQEVSYKLYGPGQAHWGNAMLRIAAIIPEEALQNMGPNESQGIKKGKISFGGGIAN